MDLIVRMSRHVIRSFGLDTAQFKNDMELVLAARRITVILRSECNN